MKEATKRSGFSMDSHYLWHSDNRVHYDSPTDTPNYAWSIRYVLFPRIADFRIVDVERPRGSTTSFEENENGTRIAGLKIQ